MFDLHFLDQNSIYRKLTGKQMLTVNIKYFGMIGEAAKKDDEVIKINEQVSVEEIKNMILQKHPPLKKMDFQIALNLSIAAGSETVNDNDELAFLPPFAGG
jgi:molybdopterin converting factor small subunit